MFKCGLSFKNSQRILGQKVLWCLQMFEVSELNIFNEVLWVDVVFLSSSDYRKVVKGYKLKVLSCLTGRMIKRKSQLNQG